MEQLLSVKVIVDVIDLRNMSAEVVHPRSSALGPLSFEVPDVVVEDFGRDKGGETVRTLVVDLTHTVLAAVLRAAPGQVAQNMQSSWGYLVQHWRNRKHASICNGCSKAIEVSAYSATDRFQIMPYSHAEIPPVAEGGAPECFLGFHGSAF